MFSSINGSEGGRQAIISVYEFPPKDCLRSEVNFESQYGICTFSLSTFPLAILERAVITFLKVRRDWLISMDSFYAIPVVPDMPTLSEPARSTNYSLETTRLSVTLSIDSKVKVKIA